MEKFGNREKPRNTRSLIGKVAVGLANNAVDFKDFIFSSDYERRLKANTRLLDLCNRQFVLKRDEAVVDEAMKTETLFFNGKDELIEISRNTDQENSLQIVRHFNFQNFGATRTIRTETHRFDPERQYFVFTKVVDRYKARNVAQDTILPSVPEQEFVGAGAFVNEEDSSGLARIGRLVSYSRVRNFISRLTGSALMEDIYLHNHEHKVLEEDIDMNQHFVSVLFYDLNHSISD